MAKIGRFEDIQNSCLWRKARQGRSRRNSMSRYITQDAFNGRYNLAEETGRLIGGFMRYLAESKHRGAKFK